jgi:DNA transformation protein
MAFDEHIADVFSAFGPIQVRRMFSGYGLFRDGLMFGLVHDDVLYLKGDDQNAGQFRELGLAQFTYSRKGKAVRLSYFRAPDAVMDDSAEAAKWARSSFEAALREASSKAKKSPKSRARIAEGRPPTTTATKTAATTKPKPTSRQRKAAARSTKRR